MGKALNYTATGDQWYKVRAKHVLPPYRMDATIGAGPLPTWARRFLMRALTKFTFAFALAYLLPHDLVMPTPCASLFFNRLPAFINRNNAVYCIGNAQYALDSQAAAKPSCCIFSRHKNLIILPKKKRMRSELWREFPKKTNAPHNASSFLPCFPYSAFTYLISCAAG